MQTHPFDLDPVKCHFMVLKVRLQFIVIFLIFAILSQSKPESQEESAESGSEIDATVEFHETDDDDDQRRSKMSGTLELITDILAPNTTSTVT